MRARLLTTSTCVRLAEMIDSVQLLTRQLVPDDSWGGKQSLIIGLVDRVEEYMEVVNPCTGDAVLATSFRYSIVRSSQEVENATGYWPLRK